MKTCKNCGRATDGKYCNNCGQSMDIHMINFQFLVHELQHSILHVDKGIFYTIKELCYRPGYAIKEYIDGKRIRYFKPVLFVLLLSTTYSLLEYSIGRQTFVSDALLGFMEGGLEKGVGKQNATILGLFEWMSSHYAYTVLLAIPMISLASYLAYIRQNRNYFQHLVLNAYIAGQITFFYIILLLPMYFVPEQYVDAFDIIKIILGLLYAGWVYFQFFADTGVISRLSSAVLTFMLFGIILAFIMFFSVISSII